MKLWKRFQLIGLLMALCLLFVQNFLLHKRSENCVDSKFLPVSNKKYDILVVQCFSHLGLQMKHTNQTYNIDEHFVNQNSKNILAVPGLHTDWRRNAMMVKTAIQKPRYITIGIPTVNRDKSNYFFNTIDSLLNCTTKDQLSEIFIVIFLADFNDTWKRQVANKLQQKYPILVKQSTIQIIEARQEFYPPLDNLQRTYNDSEARTRWRSKQNVDYAFLWLYSSGLSKYYMQIEDDVFTIPGYIDIIKQFIAEQKNDWTCLEFSQIGFIGKLFHSYHLEILAKTVLLYFDKKPVDYLYLHFNSLNLQHHRIIRRPTIFRHVGFHSSLPGKTMTAVDKYFDDIKKTVKGDNPPANLRTTLRISPDFPLELSYSLEDGYFWAHSSPKVNDTLHVLFKEPANINKVVVLTGSREHPNDILQDARMDACLSVVILKDNSITCYNTKYLGSFVNGTIRTGNIHTHLSGLKVACLKITVTKDQPFWAIIKEIAVFIDKT